MPPFNDSDGVYDFDIPEEEIIPSGVQTVRVESAELHEGSKAPYIAVTFVIVGGEFNGVTLFHNMTLSPNPFARQRTKVGLEAIFGRALPKKVNVQALLRELRGKRCKVLVGKRMWEGQARPDIVRLLPLEGSAPSAGSTSKGKSSSAVNLFEDSEEELAEEDLTESESGIPF